ncbi:MAG: tonB family protein, partial [Elusimicrobia bacterium]
SRTRTVDVRPVLLNPDEVYTNLQRYYPEAERAAKKEARVVVKLTLDAGGKVMSADVVNSGGAAFDSAARSVALRMRFSPAQREGKPVPVAFLQAINFKLD